MEEITKRIEKEFGKFGMALPEEDIKELMLSAKKYLKKKPTKEEFFQEVNNQIHIGTERIEITDFSLFSQRTKLGEKWRNYPDWFVKYINVKYSDKESAYLIDESNTVVSEGWLESVTKKDYGFIDDELTSVRKEEFLLRKAFHPESNELMDIRRGMVREAYKKIDKELRGNPVFRDLTDKIQKLFNEGYDVLYAKNEQ